MVNLFKEFGILLYIKLSKRRRILARRKDKLRPSIEGLAIGYSSNGSSIQNSNQNAAGHLLHRLVALARCDRKGIMMSRSVAKSASWSDVKLKPWHNTQKQQVTATRSMLAIEMRDRGQNRKPLQRGRNLSIEAIQAVQHLKRAHLHSNPLDHVFNSKFRRLLKFDMIAVLRELLRQNHCLLALKVFTLFYSIINSPHSCLFIYLYFFFILDD